MCIDLADVATAVHCEADRCGRETTELLFEHPDFAAAVESPNTLHERRQAAIYLNFGRVEAQGLGVEMSQDQTRLGTPRQRYIDPFVLVRVESAAGFDFERGET